MKIKEIGPDFNTHNVSEGVHFWLLKINWYPLPGTFPSPLGGRSAMEKGLPASRLKNQKLV